LTGLPSTKTKHAPHWALPQAELGAVDLQVVRQHGEQIGGAGDVAFDGLSVEFELNHACLLFEFLWQ
jgi:hypothetical protein